MRGERDFHAPRRIRYDQTYRSVQTDRASQSKILMWCVTNRAVAFRDRHATTQSADLCVTHMLRNYRRKLQTSRLMAAANP